MHVLKYTRLYKSGKVQDGELHFTSLDAVRHWVHMAIWLRVRNIWIDDTVQGEQYFTGCFEYKKDNCND